MPLCAALRLVPRGLWYRAAGNGVATSAYGNSYALRRPPRCPPKPCALAFGTPRCEVLR
jgi:hypothetical protein